MKSELIALIEQLDSIEAKFHNTPSSPGSILPSIEIIYDVSDFQVWLQSIQLELQEILDQTGDRFAHSTLECAKELYNGWNDKKNFTVLKGKLLAMKKNIEKYYPTGDMVEMVATKSPKIFISHSTNDKPYIEKIVALLDNMGLDQTQLFCSSMPGYDIPVGQDIFSYLREQFREYNLHVLFIHSPNYYKSHVCLNEMGAAWVLKSEYTSLLLPGFGFADMTGVVNSSTIAIKLDNDASEVRDKLNQFYSRIIDEFELRKKADIIWEQNRDRFIKEIQEIAQQTTSTETSVENDVQMLDSGILARKSEIASGNPIYYCPACYQNHSKLFPIVKGSLLRDRFCSNCKMHYTIR